MLHAYPDATNRSSAGKSRWYRDFYVAARNSQTLEDKASCRVEQRQRPFISVIGTVIGQRPIHKPNITFVMVEMVAATSHNSTHLGGRLPRQMVGDCLPSSPFLRELHTDARCSNAAMTYPRVPNTTTLDYGKLYGSGSRELMKVRETLFGIFGEYMKDSNTSPASSSHSQGSKEVNALTFQDDISKESSNVFKEFEDFEFAVGAQKSQLEMYLDEPRSKRTSSINVLEFWRSQQFIYPELAKLARDVLVVPVSTVASESTFNLGGRILDQYRSSMSPQVVEALICSRDC
ncbi:hypothetical protein ZIOFF_005990 [Zingiber officinale]|uniref:HAT C-terminal dimerisation domain-containing protein n=1 Tax=Zingiber officinale TaxID=94328 RepID=A0A8J5LV94_ZINOF|nr:hypothetical protein ZIOFF_005990 [Zingiber officinale]